MKTIEQAAIEYACITEDKYHNKSLCHSPYDVADAFAAGVEFAQIWRDPKTEKPENMELVITKVRVAAYGKLPEKIIYEFDRFSETKKMFEIEQLAGLEVIGWRPIELK